MNTFSNIFDQIPLPALVQRSLDTTRADLNPLLRNGRGTDLDEFAALISPAAGQQLNIMAAHSQRITQQYFGKVIRLYAPVYLSNECINVCRYCGFSRNNPIPRITLPTEQVVREADLLIGQGFRNILLVAGEHPKYVSSGYLETCIGRVIPKVPSISIEVGPMEETAYRPLVAAGCEGLVVYQETYHQDTYREMHTAGPKRRFHWRMDTPERGYEAGFRKIGIGALYGLHDWRYEALAVAAHAKYLTQTCWKAQISISMPRLRPAAGGFSPLPENEISDRELVQLVCAYRMLLPHAGIILSTREPQYLRDGLIPLGITQMSAGSSTEPGGYSHFDESSWQTEEEQPGEQFQIADERSPREVAEVINKAGYEAVWKDFDQSLATTTPI